MFSKSLRPDFGPLSTYSVRFPPIAVIGDASKVRRMVTAFLSAFAATLIVGVLARFAAIIFTSERTARVAAFAIALGFALGRYSYSGPASVTVALALTACIGAVAALVILWAWLLRKAGGAVSSANG